VLAISSGLCRIVAVGHSRLGLIRRWIESLIQSGSYRSIKKLSSSADVGLMEEGEVGSVGSAAASLIRRMQNALPMHNMGLRFFRQGEKSNARMESWAVMPRSLKRQVKRPCSGRAEKPSAARSPFSTDRSRPAGLRALGGRQAQQAVAEPGAESQAREPRKLSGSQAPPVSPPPAKRGGDGEARKGEQAFGLRAQPQLCILPKVPMRDKILGCLELSKPAYVGIWKPYRRRAAQKG